MYGLKQTFKKMPSLNKKVVEVGGRAVAIDNVVAAPPKMRNPQRVKGVVKSRNILEVSYWKEKFLVKYRTDMCSQDSIIAFVHTLIQEYVRFRHPYMNTEFIDGNCRECSNGNMVAEIQND